MYTNFSIKHQAYLLSTFLFMNLQIKRMNIRVDVKLIPWEEKRVNIFAFSGEKKLIQLHKEWKWKGRREGGRAASEIARLHAVFIVNAALLASAASRIKE